MQTRQQQRSLLAYEQVKHHKPPAENPTPDDREKEAKFKSFALSFPALIQGCGLAQALAFAQAKGPDGFLNDLAVIMKENGDGLCESARKAELTVYMRLSRDALDAATWLKRYAEALLKGEA